VIGWLGLRNQELGVAQRVVTLGLLALVYTPGVHCVTGLSEITHAVGVGSVNIGRVNHAALQVFVTLDSVVEAYVR